MFTEAFVSILLEASLTGAGLILAIYALITPILDKIIKVRKELVAEKKEQFDSFAEKVKTERSDANMNQLNKLNDALKNLIPFPKFFGVGVLFVFMLYIFVSFFAFEWFMQPIVSKSVVTEDAMAISFLVATCGFLFVGLYTISEVARTMKHQWKELEEEKEKAGKATNKELEKIEKDIEELKQKEDMRVSG